MIYYVQIVNGEIVQYGISDILPDNCIEVDKDIVLNKQNYRFDGENFIYEPVLKIKTLIEINNEVRAKIAERYDVIKEIQMINQSSYSHDSIEYGEYLEYFQYRLDCIIWGESEKEKCGYI
ncbi:hypothetical protein OXPF_06160 [Oxobacter pfennigii]|uniref:Uncharacterized protein n=1 Tax=Oxobacter pfennigii TaxID=36849 RepID=A0A0P8WD72_9CLOT|nr:hypothetical protein [Oxobacter pfennigii]KPU45827.1 hypothetical protein OXPF_06160 [Oxobacter pfennigii]